MSDSNFIIFLGAYAMGSLVGCFFGAWLGNKILDYRDSKREGK